MSMMYAIFSILPALLSSMKKLDDWPTRHLILHLHSFIRLAFWRPSSTDGQQAWFFVHGEKKSYHNVLFKITCNFVNAVDKYVIKYPHFGKYVDRPNTHRVLELTLHTLPSFHHLNFVTELVFEDTHQPLKFLLSRNLTSNGHIQSVQVILLKDWIYRIWCLSSGLS